MKLGEKMKIGVLAFLTAGSFSLFADYTIVFELRDTNGSGETTETVYLHKSAKQNRLDSRSMEGTLQQSLLQSGGKAYRIRYGYNGTLVSEMNEVHETTPQLESGPSNQNASHSVETTLMWEATGLKKSVGGIEGEIWEAVQDGDAEQPARIVLTDDKTVRKAFEACDEMRHRFVAADKIVFDAFFMKEGYTLIEYEGQYRLTRFNEETIADDTFAIPENAQFEEPPKAVSVAAEKSGPAESQREAYDKACYEKVCCGQIKAEASVIINMARTEAGDYRLQQTATCDMLGLGALFGVDSVEGALYQKGEEFVTVTLDMDANDQGPVLQAKKSGAKSGAAGADQYQTGILNGHVFHYAVLQPQNVQVLDVILDEHTIVSFSHRIQQAEMPMIAFAERAIDFNAYDPKGVPRSQEEKPDAQQPVEPSVKEQNNSGSQGVDKAVEMLKRLL